MATKTVQDSSLTLVADAIRAKGGTSAQLEFPDEFVSAIQNIPTGGGSVVEPKDVNFYDYDGTLTNSYTASEFAALSAMPANPSHDGLTAQGWNWTLADAQAYVSTYHKLNVGQMYVTTSGDTEIDIRLGLGRNKPYLGICPNGTMDIDWGDGSAHSTLTGTSTTELKQVQHIYPDTGEMFTITLHMDSGEFGFGSFDVEGEEPTYYESVLISTGDKDNYNGKYAYQGSVKAIRLGNKVNSIRDEAFSSNRLEYITMPDSIASIGSSAFCYNNLQSIIIPSRVTRIEDSTFSGNHGTQMISFPRGVTYIGERAFGGNESGSSNNLQIVTLPDRLTVLGSDAFQGFEKVVVPSSLTTITSGLTPTSITDISLPNGVTAITDYAFSSCNFLTKVVIPSSVESIGEWTFVYLQSLAELKFESATPPTIGRGVLGSDDVNAVPPSDCIIYVPAESLSAYQAAIPHLASQMVEYSA